MLSEGVRTKSLLTGNVLTGAAQRWEGERRWSNLVEVLVMWRGELYADE